MVAGEGGIQAGGGVQVQFPAGWFVSPWPYPKALQSEDPSQPDHVGAATSSAAASLLLKQSPYGIDGQYHRFARTLAVYVEGGELAAGDVISLTWANTRAPQVAEVDCVRLAVDAGRDGQFDELPGAPCLPVEAGPPARLRLIAPSQATAGAPTTFRLVALDGYENATGQFQGSVTFRSTDGQAGLPAPYTFSATDGGTRVFTATLRTPGVQTIEATVASAAWGQAVRSNPVQVSPTPAEMQLLWGDVHSHSALSHDGIGRADSAFRYARQVSGLDFYALTEHSRADDGSVGLTDGEWTALQTLVAESYEAGVFVPFLGYEWSGHAPYGHRNIVYRAPTGPIFRRGDYNDLSALWQAFAGAGLDVLTVPHHTAIVWGGDPRWPADWAAPDYSPYVDWSYASPTFQRAAEVYSLHGAGEFYGNPLAYEDVAYGLPGATSHPGPHYLRDGWAAGQRLGVVASSDNHTAQPGLPHGGLTAVYVPEPTREAIFEALAAGRSYATTGARLLLEFRADGHWPGEAYETDDPPVLDVRVVGTADLDYVELIRFDGESYAALHQVTSVEGAEVSFRFVDATLAQTSLYYVRAGQRGQVGGREVLAWSSPIWITLTADLVEPGRYYLPCVVRADS